MEKDELFRAAMEARAIFWYEKALPDLTGIRKEHVVKRLSRGIHGLAAGLVLYYDFDERVEDRVSDKSPSGNDGKVAGATWKVEPDRGGVLVFDGKDDYVDCGNDLSLDLSDDFSLSVWVNVGKFRRGVGIVSKYQRHDSFTLRESFNTKERKFTFGDFGSSVVQKKACSTDKWYHFVAVVDNGDLKFYINGKLNNVGGKDRPLTRNRESVNLGRCYSSRYFLGAMDNVRIYKRVLSAKEVKELYASEK